MRGSDSAPVAQLDRVSGYEPEGRAFESLRARQLEMNMGTSFKEAPIFICATASSKVAFAPQEQSPVVPASSLRARKLTNRFT
jgi:hypothetical protein